jgi:hypothetical protein
MEDEQIGRRRPILTPLEIVVAVVLFGVIVLAGVLMLGHLSI